MLKDSRQSPFPTCPLPASTSSFGQDSCPSEWWLDLWDTRDRCTIATDRRDA